MRRLAALTLAMALPAMAGCVAGPVAGQPSRSLVHEGSTWGYDYHEAGGIGQVLGDFPSMLWGPEEAVITIVTRDGQPVAEADRDAATRAARRICEMSGRAFLTAGRGTVLARGGLSYAGRCQR